MGFHVRFGSILFCALLLSCTRIATAAPPTLLKLIDTQSIQIGGILREGPNPAQWDDQYANPDSDKFDKLQDTLCIELHNALTELQDPWSRCFIEQIGRDEANDSLVYVVVKLILMEPVSIDLEVIRNKLQWVFSSASQENVLAGQIIVSISKLQIEGNVQKGPYPIEWTDDYLNSASQPFIELQETLCKSIKDAVTLLRDSWNGCEISSLQQVPNGNTHVYAITSITLTGNKSVDLELVKQELEKVFSVSVNAIGLGDITVSAPQIVTTSSMNIEGLIKQGQNLVPWQEQFGVKGSPLFNMMQQSLCSSMTKVFETMKVTLAECKVVQMNQASADPSSVHASVSVSFTSEQTIDLRKVKEELQLMAITTPSATILGDMINITVDETATTISTEAYTTTTLSTTVEVDSSIIELGGYVYIGYDPAPWNPLYANQDSSAFAILEQALCQSLNLAINSINPEWKNCAVIRANEVAGNPSGCYVRVQIKVNPGVTVDVNGLKKAIQEILKVHPDWTVLGGDIEIISSASVTTTEAPLEVSNVSSIQMSGIVMQGQKPLPWKDEYLNKDGPEFEQLQTTVCNNMKATMPTLIDKWNTCTITDIKEASGKQTAVTILITLNSTHAIDLDKLEAEAELSIAGATASTLHLGRMRMVA